MATFSDLNNFTTDCGRIKMESEKTLEPLKEDDKVNLGLQIST